MFSLVYIKHCLRKKYIIALHVPTTCVLLFSHLEFFFSSFMNKKVFHIRMMTENKRLEYHSVILTCKVRGLRLCSKFNERV